MTVHDVTHLFQIPLEWPRERLQVGRVDGITVHHCATPWLRPDATVEEEINHLRAIDRYHREVRGFLGFAYHLAAFPTGRIYHVTSLKQWGAHVYQENDHLYGIVVIGNFIASVPGDKQLDATAEGIKFLDDFLGRKVEVGPHRKWGSSTCPGNPWEQWVPGLRIEEDEMTDEQFNELMKRIDGHATFTQELIRAEAKKILEKMQGHHTFTQGLIKEVGADVNKISGGGGNRATEAEVADVLNRTVLKVT